MHLAEARRLPGHRFLHGFASPLKLGSEECIGFYNTKRSSDINKEDEDVKAKNVDVKRKKAKTSISYWYLQHKRLKQTGWPRFAGAFLWNSQ